MIVQHKITLEIKEKLTSSAIAYPLYAWLLSHISKETGDALHEQGLRPISQYVYREGEHIRWVVNLLNDEAAELFGPILERESAALIHQGVIPFGEHRTETIESAQCLLGRARNMDAGNRFALDMVTPTAFKQSGRYAIFPQESLMLQSLITRWGLCFPEFPLDDPDVMSLFHDTSALGIAPDDIGGCPVGCLGIPEFGTDFVIQMVVDTKPKTLSDLIRISGLSHGTDVWLNNAQDLIKSGKATISTAICTRDDIMTYLINKGLDSEESFTIMERVRKGTVAKGKCKEWPDFKKDMIDHDVPDWYIGSCEKIKYMFPKAHAAAYVMMAYRIAYCKVNYPLAYYGAYFGIRANAFSYEKMCQGKEKLQYYINDYTRRSSSLTNKEQDEMKDMHIVQEMYARGFEFMPIDIYKAKATKFQIIDGKLMPPFSTIDGMGDKAAEAVEVAAKDGPYLSRDDFRQRTKASKTVIDTMNDLGLFGELPESNQLSLFDF